MTPAREPASPAGPDRPGGPSPGGSHARARYGRQLRDALVALGQQAPVADGIVAEALAHAEDAGVPPVEVFGPAVVHARAVVDGLHVRPDDPLPSPGRPVLRLDGVSKRYRSRLALAPVSLTLHAGEVAAVVGANGSGKTTFLQICAGLVRPTGGTVRRSGTVGYVPQERGVVGLLTVDEHVTLFGAAAGMTRRRARSAGGHLAGRLSWRPSRRQVAQQLSGGTQQKLNLLLGDLHSPDLLLLDEPYQGFDHGAYLDFWHQVWTWRHAGRAVVVVTHLLHELDRVDHLVDLGAAGAAPDAVRTGPAPTEPPGPPGGAAPASGGQA